MLPEPTRRALALLRTVPHGRLALTRQALPHVAVARHTVTGDGKDGERLLVRLSRAWGIHQDCDGTVVAYQSDNLDTTTGTGNGTGRTGRWSLQFTGTARIVVPTPSDRFELPVDADEHNPVYLRIDPCLMSVQFARDVPEWPAPHPS